MEATDTVSLLLIEMEIQFETNGKVSSFLRSAIVTKAPQARQKGRERSDKRKRAFEVKSNLFRCFKELSPFGNKTSLLPENQTQPEKDRDRNLRLHLVDRNYDLTNKVIIHAKLEYCRCKIENSLIQVHNDIRDNGDYDRITDVMTVSTPKTLTNIHKSLKLFLDDFVTKGSIILGKEQKHRPFVLIDMKKPHFTFFKCHNVTRKRTRNNEKGWKGIFSYLGKEAQGVDEPGEVGKEFEDLDQNEFTQNDQFMKEPISMRQYHS
ncbi:hypothetical protein EGR_00979 [Echinococcus granulosus]|uniref:Uncharacterized protein n=1 Tax=Echinococcus granulosus TaxID=6210 RepID=W6URZ4_ECHGR|nr:hypothetical protein EGR_00979 [Echinococcus granulosus]EUB64435.1 hypothetical protein EGR_00979 [Echinococcus granulosus]